MTRAACEVAHLAFGELASGELASGELRCKWTFSLSSPRQ